MPAPFSLTPQIPAANEAMRAVMRSFDDEVPPFTAHRAGLAATVTLGSSRKKSGRVRPRRQSTR